MKIGTITRDTINKVKAALKEFNNDTLHSLGILLPALAVATSIVGFIVAFIINIVQGGYADQVALINVNGIAGITDAFSSGTTSILYGNLFGTTIKFLLTFQMIILLITFFSQATKTKKVIMIFDLSFIALIGITLFLMDLREGNFIINFLYRLEAEQLKMYLIILVITLVAAFVSSLIVLLTTKCRWMLGYACAAGAISFLAVPLVLLVVQNIIVIILSIIILAMIGIILSFVLGSASSDTMSTGNSVSNYSGYNQPRSEKKENAVSTTSDIKQFSGNVKFYRGKGGLGLGVPQNKCIYFDGNLTTRGYVCTVKDYEEGKVVIMLNNQRVTNI
ncbi:hypothetical protein PRVXT_001553 [Proteinivorax tanatarense]|uniref:Uncharacterized protein n=1 Tax=Proteinivorax tanatarense TaxID=1260629 RepID=A0AAU7VHR0_9FIRM